MFKHLALAMMLLTSVAAHADPRDSGIVLRIYSAPAWCGHCQRQEAKMREYGFTQSVPVTINGHPAQVRVELLDVAVPANQARANREGIHSFPTNQVVVDDAIIGSRSGALIERQQFIDFIQQSIRNPSSLDINGALNAAQPLGDPRDAHPSGNLFNPIVEPLHRGVNRSPAISGEAGL